MSRLPLRTLEDAPESTKAPLTAVEKSTGFLPNLLRVLANAPVALETYMTVSGINARGSLSLAEREAVQITAAAKHGCDYCVAAHSRVAEKRAKLDKAVIGALRDRTAVSDTQIDAIARFTEAVIATRRRPTKNSRPIGGRRLHVP
jgi:AhpD family alkylhydroperoxidase